MCNLYKQANTGSIIWIYAKGAERSYGSLVWRFPIYVEIYAITKRTLESRAIYLLSKNIDSIPNDFIDTIKQ